MCGGRLETNWLITTVRPSDGRRSPGVGLLCIKCGQQYDWMNMDGYRLVERKTGQPVLGTNRKPRPDRPQPSQTPALQAYYAGLTTLRKALEAAGQPQAARRLLDAERGSMTSGEMLSETGLVLRELITSGAAESADVVSQVESLDYLGRQVWNA